MGAVDEHFQAEHARLTATHDRRVVERGKRPPAQIGRQHHARLERVIVGDQRRQRRLERDGIDLGQEAHVARVDPQHGNVDRGQGLRGAQEGPVAAQDYETVGAAQPAYQGVEVLGLG